MDDAFIYCSELIYKAFKTASGEELGKTITLGEMNWKPHKATIEKYNEGPVPMDRVMITPRHMAESDKLDLIYTSYNKRGRNNENLIYITINCRGIWRGGVWV